MKFGAALPTCAEGAGYPIGFAPPDVLATIAERAEALGFHAVMANDHLSTPNSIRRTFDRPPNFYEPLTVLAYCAARTDRIKLMTGAVVLSIREPVLLAKQVTTLDHCCDGRLIVGVAAGAHREEFEAVRPELRHASRADLLDEGVQALRALLGRRRTSFHGRYYRFEDVELYPKVKQPRPPWGGRRPRRRSASRPPRSRRIGPRWACRVWCSRATPSPKCWTRWRSSAAR